MDDKAPRSKVISMNEDIGTLIRRGFETWRGNLNLAVPFVLMIVAIMVLGVAMVFAAMYPLTTTSPELLSTAGDLVFRFQNNIATFNTMYCNLILCHL